MMQAGLTSNIPISMNEVKAYHINQRNEGIDLGDVSGALMATQNMQMQTFITAPHTGEEVKKSPIAFAANQRDEVRNLHDVAGALQASPGIKQQTFVAGFSAGAGSKAGSIAYNEAVSPTLKGSPSGNAMPSVLCLNDQGGKIMGCSEDISGTLRAQEHGHQPLVMATQQGGAEIGVGVCPAITAAAGMSGNNQPLLYENHGVDSRYTGPYDVAPTMSARYGTGGNNTPLVQRAEVFCISGNTIDREPHNGGNGIGWQENIAYSLTTVDRHSVFSRQRVDQFRDDDVASTESARQHKDATDLVLNVAGLDCRNANENGDLRGTLQPGTSGTSLNSIHPVRTGQLIRRLTPLECERLQGYPDGWTDVPGASDSARYKALGNSVAIPCVEYLMERVAMVILLDLKWDF